MAIGKVTERHSGFGLSFDNKEIPITLKGVISENWERIEGKER